jgi:uncharacterized protein YuzE
MKRTSAEVTYDRDADMAYVALVEREAGAIANQVYVEDDDLPSTVIINLGGDGRIRGFELSVGSRILPLKLLDALR